MIYDTIDHAKTYLGLHPNLDKALEFLTRPDLAELPDGRQEIDGDAVFANLMTYETKPANDTPESHRRYIDIQYLLEGQELVGVAPLSSMTEKVSANPAGDIWLHRGGPLHYLPLGQGKFQIFFPQDAHAPGIAPDAPSPARKAVIKVRLD